MAKIKKTEKKSLIETNPYLKDPEMRRKYVQRSVRSSCGVEGIPDPNKKDLGQNPKDLIGATKTPISLIPPAGIEEIAKAMKNGADKYQAYNWRQKKVQYMIYLDAILRHTMALIEREDIAEDSGVHHLGHIGANTVILLDAIKYDCLVDNRPQNPELDYYKEKKVNKPSDKDLRHLIQAGLISNSNNSQEVTLKLASEEKELQSSYGLGQHYPESYACQTNQCRCGKTTVRKIPEKPSAL